MALKIQKKKKKAKLLQQSPKNRKIPNNSGNRQAQFYIKNAKWQQI